MLVVNARIAASSPAELDLRRVIDAEVAIGQAAGPVAEVAIGPSGAAGIRGVVVMLYDSTGKKIATTRSEFDGFYSFAAIPGGDYEIRITRKSGRSVFVPPRPAVRHRPRPSQACRRIPYRECGQ